MSTLYFIRRQADDAIKIGITTDLRRRVTDLRRIHGNLEVLGVVEGAETREKLAHLLFADSRLDGEFFESSSELQEFMDRYASPPPPSINTPIEPTGFRGSHKKPWIDLYGNPGVVVKREKLVEDYQSWIDDELVAASKEHSLGIIRNFPEEIVFRPQPGLSGWGWSPLNPRCWVDRTGRRLYGG